MLDFDWAGVAGRDVYPPFMNPDIDWPNGAEAGKSLQFEHDVEWIESL